MKLHVLAATIDLLLRHSLLEHAKLVRGEALARVHADLRYLNLIFVSHYHSGL